MTRPAPTTEPSGLRPVSGHQPAEGGIAARARATADAPYLRDLNPEQREAVETTDGPVLVLAGAGTGKTRALTTRLTHLLTTRKARPGELLAVTFTNKAAREMQARTGDLIGNVVEGMRWLGTFHSIGVKMLRRDAELVGLRSDFSILDTDDQIRLLKQLIVADNIDPKRWPARQLAAFIDRWKNRGMTPDKVPAGEAFAFANGKGAELYGAYQQRLKILNAADFGDLLLESFRLLQENPDLLKSYQERFRYMLVDEYQDTNAVQYLWLKLLAQGHGNICCVGDDDQSIYGWRGADVDNILRFEKDFPGAKVIRLERNYRSSEHILGAASGLIAHNEARLGKTLHTEIDGGDRIAVQGVWDSGEEARQIGEDIEQAQRGGHLLDEIAILVRASFQMREFEERFITLGLPYRVIGGPRFYERLEIRDALAYLKLVVQGDNDLAFERIVNVPKRGLGDAALKILHGFARSARVSLMQAATSLIETDELTARARASLKGFVEDIARWRAMIDTTPHTELAEIILDESGYTAMWQKDKSANAPGRLENLKELVRAMGEYENLAGFLEHVALVMERDSGPDEDKVNLMTLHSAKGLEFDTVFLPGWEEGLFPHQRAMDESGHAGLEEERRLAYVGLTRARKRAKITFAGNRRVHNLWQSAIPSRFLDELPEAHVDVEETSGGYGGLGGFGESRFDRRQDFASSYDTPGWQRARRAAGDGATPSRGPRTIEGELVATEDPAASRHMVGERIFHQKFGYGRIAAADGNKLTIDFEKSGRKKVLDSFVERH